MSDSTGCRLTIGEGVECICSEFLEEYRCLDYASYVKLLADVPIGVDVEFRPELLVVRIRKEG